MARPRIVDAPFTTDKTGQVVTVGQHYCARLELGVTPTAAARETGIHPASPRNWLARGRQALQVSEETGTPVTDDDAPYVAFLAAVEAAEGRAKALILDVIRRAATEPQTVRKVVSKKELRDVQGQPVMVEVERTESVEERPAQWTAAAWLGERRFPNEFGRTTRIVDDTSRSEVEGVDRVKSLAEEAEAYLSAETDAAEDAAARVIDVEATGPE